MNIIDVKTKGHPLEGLWLWRRDTAGYSNSLHRDLWTEAILSDIHERTKLSLCDGWDDWFSFESPQLDNPIMTWAQLIALSLNILNAEATRLFVRTLYLKVIPKVVFKEFEGDLPSSGVSGAKRVNASSGDYYDHSASVGIKGLINQVKGNDIPPKKISNSNNHFRLSGKDESCGVEGEWLHWVLFACNVLASKNTEIVCPEIYAPTMENDNY